MSKWESYVHWDQHVTLMFSLSVSVRYFMREKRLLRGYIRFCTMWSRVNPRQYRALRLDQGVFSWATEAISRKVRIIDVVYNASNNELVRTKTLVKGAIVTIDSTPFRQVNSDTPQSELNSTRGLYKARQLVAYTVIALKTTVMWLFLNGGELLRATNM